MNKVIIIGAGRMAFSIATYLQSNNIPIIGFTDIKEPGSHISNFHKMYLGPDESILKYAKNEVELVLAISDTFYRKKEEIFQRFKDKGFHFKTVIYPNVYYDSTVQIDEGTIIFNNVNINSFTHIAEIALVNSNVSIDHDCYVGFNSYISPGVTVAGSVSIAKNVLIGSGAIILPTRRIEEGAILGAGAVLTKDIPPHELWFGSPAKLIRKV